MPVYFLDRPTTERPSWQKKGGDGGQPNNPFGWNHDIVSDKLPCPAAAEAAPGPGRQGPCKLLGKRPEKVPLAVPASSGAAISLATFA